MIKLTRLDGSEFYVNAEFIQSVESNPDTHIVLLNGHSYIVTETDEDVVGRMLEYRRAASNGGGTGTRLAATAGELRLVDE
ncbi:MAG: flagellar FlbD family protein [Dehalococcoidia bacterium]